MSTQSDNVAAVRTAHDILCPESLFDYVGQESIKDKLTPWINEALETKQPMGHVLITSEPGCGKTTLAKVIANEVCDDFHQIDLSRMTEKQFVSFMRRFEGGIIFVDEIHRPRPSQQEFLLTPMEEGYVATAYGYRIEVPWLTIIAATTEPHLLLPSVVSRFDLELELEPYTDEQMTLIVAAMAEKLEVEIGEEDVQRLAAATGGIPRTARELVKTWRASRYDGTPSVERTLSLAGLEADGLTKMHMDYLRALDRMEGLAGERPLANVLRVHPRKVTQLEKLLISRNLVTLTPQGRALTGSGSRRVRGDHSYSRTRS